MKRKIGKSLAKSAISIKGITIIFAAIILTSVYYAQEEGEILLHSEKKEQKSSMRDELPMQMTARQLLQNVKEKNYTGELVEFNFKKAPVKRILSLFSKISGLKIEAEPNIVGEMSCKGKKWQTLIRR